MRVRRAAIVAVVCAVLAPGVAPAAAQLPDSGYCLQRDPPPASAPSHALRFGITPLVAGNVGLGQGDPVPFDPDRDLEAVRHLRPDDRELVLRLNRMFWADGEEGVRRFAAIVDRYAAAGFRSELQVRYHPPDGAAGDLDAWEDYVRFAARTLGEREALSALSITNEANLALSPNTSDGAHEGVREAIVRGVVAARDELDRLGREDVELGFSVAWRWLPHEDRGFWEELGELATPGFLEAIDHVGVQLYPGLVWPPAPLPGRSAGHEVLEALTLVRECYLPMGRLDHVDLWVSENGYATNLGRTEAMQDEALRSTVEELHRLSGTLGITDYRWFNLRDNRSTGTDLFDAVGLLRDDYTPKPAYGTFQTLLDRYGTAAATVRRSPPAAVSPAPTDGRRGTPPPTEEPPRPRAGTGTLPVTGRDGTGTAPGLVALLAGVALVQRRWGGARRGSRGHVAWGPDVTPRR